MKIKNKQTSRQTIVFCGYDEDLSASTLHGEHYLRFMCTIQGLRPSHEGRHTFLWKIIIGPCLLRLQWKFWSKWWTFVWQWRSWLRCMCTLKVSISHWKLQTPVQILPSAENFPLTVNLTTELFLPSDRYSSVRADYTLPQSFSHAPRLTNAVGENSLKGSEARTWEDQTQEYNTINITRMRRAALDWQTAWWLACKTEGGQVYSLTFLFICAVIRLRPSRRSVYKWQRGERRVWEVCRTGLSGGEKLGEVIWISPVCLWARTEQINSRLMGKVWRRMGAAAVCEQRGHKADREMLLRFSANVLNCQQE